MSYRLLAAWVLAIGLGACGRLGFGLSPFVDAGLSDAGANLAHDAGASTAGNSTGSASGDGVPIAGASGGGAPTAGTTAGAPTAGATDNTPTAGTTAGAPTAGTSAAGATGGAGTSAAVSCSVAATSDYCTQLERLPNRPVIDGKLDCNLALRTITPLDWTGTTPIPSDHQGARLAVAWHPEGLYFYIEVTDGSVARATSSNPAWCGDSVEVYVDSDGVYPNAPAYDDPGTVQLIAAAPGGADQPVSRDGERYRDGNLLTQPPWNNTNHGAYFTDTGYVFEAFITAEDQDLTSFSLRSGDHIGFDIAINLSLSSAGQAPDCDVHYGQYYLAIAQRACSGMSCQPHDNSAALCSPVLQ